LQQGLLQLKDLPAEPAHKLVPHPPSPSKSDGHPPTCTFTRYQPTPGPLIVPLSEGA
jgi:hypothetical protein